MVNLLIMDIKAYMVAWEQKKFMRMMRTFISVIRTEYLIAKYVEKKFGKEVAERIFCENPNMIIENK